MELVISANYTHVIVLEQGFENDFKLFVAKFQIQILIFSYNFFLQNAYTYHPWRQTSLRITSANRAGQRSEVENFRE